MPRHVRPKTSQKAQSQSKSRLKKRSNIPHQTPRLKRSSDQAKEPTQLDPELALYGRAIDLFNSRQFQPAKEVFERLLAARNRDLAHSAELRIRMCEQRLAPARSDVIAEIL